MSSRFFPRKIREDVTFFYAFVRVIDNIVDEKPVQPRAFYTAKQCFYNALSGTATHYPIMHNFARLVQEKNIDMAYIDAFFASMEWDLQPSFAINSMDKCLWYMYGSAEVVALIMHTLCNVYDESLLFSAARLGRAMQYVNFIRDIHEDEQKGRRYIPLHKTNLPDLRRETAIARRDEFEAFIRTQIQMYGTWLTDSVPGMRVLPSFVRVPIVTSAELYTQVAHAIYKNPMRIFDTKLQPTPMRALGAALSTIVLRKKKPRGIAQLR